MLFKVAIASHASLHYYVYYIMKYFFPVILMLRTAMEQGMVNCNASMNSVLDETKAHLIDPLDTVFYDPFKNISGRRVLKM